MGKLFVGNRAGEFYPGFEAQPISKVEILDENGDIVGEAGDNTGRTLTATNPDGSSAMAASMLASVGGFVYKPYEGRDAMIDPAAELGDGITIGGMYSVLAQTDITYDGLYSADVAAPTTDEIDDEYPYISPIKRQVQRNYAKTRSLITKTAEEIRLAVEGVDGRVSALSVTLDGVTITDESGQTLIKGSSIDTSTIKANSITVDKLYLTGSISWSDLATDAQNQVVTAQNTASSAYSLANTANSSANSAISSVSAWTYPGSTYIDGSKLMTGTVLASKLLGGYVGLLNAYQQTLGQIAIGASSSGYAIELNSTGGGLRLSAAANFWVDSSYGSMGITASGAIFSVPPIPIGTGSVSLGTASFKWSQVYAATGTINTSDREEKNTINYDLEKYNALFDGLRPCSYKLNDGSSGRTHVGMISQDVEESLAEAELTSLDFAGFIKTPRDEGGYAYGLRYSEFIALCVWQIQQLKGRVAELEVKSGF